MRSFDFERVNTMAGFTPAVDCTVGVGAFAGVFAFGAAAFGAAFFGAALGAAFLGAAFFGAGVAFFFGAAAAFFFGVDFFGALTPERKWRG